LFGFLGDQGKKRRDFIAHKKGERWGGGLSAQADAFAGANAEEKIGLLRSE